MSLGLALAGLFVAIIIGIPLGILAGMRPGGVVDRLSVTGTSFGLAIPNFVLAFLLIQVFALTLGWFPAVGYTKFSESPHRVARNDHAAGDLARCDRGGIGRASDPRRDHRRAAVQLRPHRVRRGHGTRRTVVKYAFKNAAIPTVTVLGLQLAALIGGVVIIEQMFSIPGLGTYMLRGADAARRARDPGGDDHVRGDLRGAQPHRRHQLRLPQPAGASLVSDEHRFGGDFDGPLAGDLPPSPLLVEDAGIALDEGVVATRTPSPWKRAFKRLLRDKPAIVALAFLLLIIALAVVRVAGGTARPAMRLGTPFETPSLDHPLGTDHLGRDTFSRIIYGARGVAALRVPDRGHRACLRAARSACSRGSVAAASTSPSCG